MSLELQGLSIWSFSIMNIYIYIYIYIYPPPCRSLRRPLRRVQCIGEAADLKFQVQVFKFYCSQDPVPVQVPVGGGVWRSSLEIHSEESFLGVPTPFVAAPCVEPYLPGRPKIHQKIIKISIQFSIDFLTDFGSHLASNFEPKSTPNR